MFHLNTLLTLTNKFVFDAQSYQMCTWSLMTTYLQKAQKSYMTINTYGDAIFAANLVEAIRGRTRPARLLTSQTRPPRRQQSETVPGTVPHGTYASYSSAVKGIPVGVSSHQQAPQSQQQVNRLYGQSPNNPMNNSVDPQNRDATVEVPKELISFFRFIKSFI